MAPKIKVTSQMIVNVASDIVEQNGYDAVTARSVASALSCSTQPIYSCFSNMEDLKAVVFDLSCTKCLNYIFGNVSQDDFLCSFSKSYLKLALERPKLFRSVFIQPFTSSLNIYDYVKTKYDIHDIFGEQGVVYNLTDDLIKQIFDKVYYFTLGYSVMLTGNGIAEYTDEIANFLDKSVRELISGSFISYGY